MARKKRSTIGERNPMSKLTNEDVKNIKHLLSEKLSDSDIAEQYKVCRQTVNNIKNGKVWNHG
jgi:IS30 family transposase